MKWTPLFIALFAAQYSHAQLSGSVDFNKPGDLANNFTGQNYFVQLSGSGITGGCIASQLQRGDWLSYIHKGSIPLSGLTASICFKYKRDLQIDIQAISAALELRYDATNNPSLATYVLRFYIRTGTLTAAVYSGNGNATSTQLANDAPLDGHWYKLQTAIATSRSGSTLSTTTQVYDLGNDGQGMPVLVGNIPDYEFSNGFEGNSNVSILFNGENIAGTELMDDFKVTPVFLSSPGLKLPDHQFNASFIADGYLHITTSESDPRQYELYSMTGQRLRAGRFEREINVDCTDLANSVYLVRLLNTDSWTVKKIIKY